MRILFFGLGLVFTMVATIILFQNNNAVGLPLYVFFNTINDSYFNTFLLMFCIGSGAGLFFGLGLKSSDGKSSADDEF